jgi:cobalt-precorrin-5B (C1)-methyltransferase
MKSIKDPISGGELSGDLIKKASMLNEISESEIAEGVKKGRFILLESGKILKRGYTTGTCAAAAAKGAILALLGLKTGKIVVSVNTPIGLRVELAAACRRVEECGICSVIKDAGDDIDATHEAEIIAEARFGKGEGIDVLGGIGIGVVTRRGLPVPVGSSAINPEPLRQIREAVGEAMNEALGSWERKVVVEIKVPSGEKIAKKTLNSLLGINGGISILGNTGFVEPFSLDAYDGALLLQLSIIREEGFDCVVLATGARSGAIAVELLGVPRIAVVRPGTRLEPVLKGAREKGFRAVVLLGLPNKMVKLAIGLIDPASYQSPLKMEELLGYLKEASPGTSLIPETPSVSGLLDLLPDEFFVETSKRVSLNCSALVFGADVTSVVVSRDGKVLGSDRPLEEIRRLCQMRRGG